MRKTLPVALTIAGSDSGGGAGIQADLKTFASLGLHGTSALTCVTAQNPKGVSAIQPCSVAMVQRQVEAVLAELPPAAVKTGMLYSGHIIGAIVGLFRRRPDLPLVVDPVMIATSGARLLKPAALELLKRELLPRATVVTPNLHEAEILTGSPISSAEDLRAAAKAIHRQFGCAALVKGGHLRGSEEAIDICYDGKTELLLASQFVKGLKLHGAGCTYSAAICAYLALGHSLPRAVGLAKQYISEAIVSSRLAGRHSVLNSFWRNG